MILKQTGSAPPTYRVRFPPDRARRIGGAGRVDRPRHQPARGHRRGTRGRRPVTIPAPHTPTPCTGAIGSPHLDMLAVTPQLLMWIDDQGLITGAPVNPVAAVLLT